MESVTSENITNEFLAFNQSQWTSNGSNIYLNSSVGIGTSLPRANLDVYGSINALSANFGTVYTGGTSFTSLNVSGESNLLGNVVVKGNLFLTGNLINVTSNTQISNSLIINNAGISTALKVHQLENVPVHYNNVAEFWDYQTLALLINGDGNVGIHTTVINPYAFAVVGSSNLDYINTINVYSSNAVSASNLYGNVVGSNTVSASTIYGTLAGANTVSSSGLYGPIIGSNTVTASTIYGTLAGANTITGSSVSATTLYGQLAGANTIAGSSMTLTTALDPSYGGTGLSGYTVGDIIYASGTTTLSKLADVATGSSLISGGVGVAPSWGKVGLTTHVSGTLPVANGGTNLTTYTSGGLIYASGTGTLASSAAYTAGQVLYGGGAGSAPASSSSLFWDSGNLRIGIGTNTPTHTVNIWGSGTIANSTANPQVGQLSIATTSGSQRMIFGSYYTGGTGAISCIQATDYYSSLDHGDYLCLNPIGGNVGIGITNPGYLLDVNGTAHCSGILYVGNNSTATAAGSEGGKIYLAGTYGDSAFDHNVIVSRLYATNEASEIVIFKGNDASGGAGPDRIRLRAANICFDTYTSGTTDYSATNIRMTINDNGYVNYTTTYKYNIFYAPPNWSYSTTTLNAWSQLWSFTYNFPQASYVVATITGHWQCQTNGYSAYIGILIDGAAQQSSSLYDSYTVGGAGSQGGYWHQYYNSSIAWHGFSHTVCAKVTAGNHTFGGGIYAFNANTFYMNGAAITLQVTPINYL